jgi:rod shape determining protein RodA
MLIFLIVFRCIVIAMRSDIFYGKLIAGSFGAMLTFQTFCNVGVTAGLLPNTGMIFPFISAGGSAMWVFMALTGMVINIGITKRKPMFAD